jgi:hypothetical protein
MLHLVRVVAYLPVSVTDEVDGARAHAEEQFAMYRRLPSYRATLDREVYLGPQDAALIGDEQAVAERIDGLIGRDQTFRDHTVQSAQLPRCGISVLGHRHRAVCLRTPRSDVPSPPDSAATPTWPEQSAA